MFLISRDWDTYRDRREYGWSKIQKKFLEESLLLSVRKLKLGRKFTFQHDNDPKHTVTATLEWLRNKKINVLEWPSQSLDINPIENLWHDSKIDLHQRSPCNLTDLEQFCAEEWAASAQSRCVKLVETYPNRLTAVIAVKGASTKYKLRGWPLVQPRYSSFVFLINFLKFVSFVFQLEVVGYDV